MYRYLGILLMVLGGVTVPVLFVLLLTNPQENTLKALFGWIIYVILGISYWRYGKRVREQREKTEKEKSAKRDWHYSLPNDHD